jgi:hypothetical protein
MLELITFVLLQLATLNGTTTKVGSSGWGNDATTAQTSSVGSSGWGNDKTSTTQNQTQSNVGSSGWGNDKL